MRQKVSPAWQSRLLPHDVNRCPKVLNVARKRAPAKTVRDVSQIQKKLLDVFMPALSRSLVRLRAVASIDNDLD